MLFVMTFAAFCIAFALLAVGISLGSEKSGDASCISCGRKVACGSRVSANEYYLRSRE